MPAALVALVTLAGGPAHADDRAAWSTRPRKDPRVVRRRPRAREAREQSGPAARVSRRVQRDCVAWTRAGIERASRQSSSRRKTSAAPAPRTRPRVTMDGQPFATQLDGQSVAVNPGKHVFRFEQRKKWSEGSPGRPSSSSRAGGERRTRSGPVSRAAALGRRVLAAPRGGEAAATEAAPRPAASEGSGVGLKAILRARA